MRIARPPLVASRASQPCRTMRFFSLGRGKWLRTLASAADSPKARLGPVACGCSTNLEDRKDRVVWFDRHRDAKPMKSHRLTSEVMENLTDTLFFEE